MDITPTWESLVLGAVKQCERVGWGPSESWKSLIEDMGQKADWAVANLGATAPVIAPSWSALVARVFDEIEYANTPKRRVAAAKPLFAIARVLDECIAKQQA